MHYFKENKMNKLQMAHQMALMLLKNAPLEEVSNAISTAWQYADAMQAEADKRKSKPELPSLQQTFINGVEQPRYAPTCEEWQPDWSQAPENTTHWGMELGSAYWLKEEGNGLFCKIGKASLFGYTGNQQGSLRKRPQ